MADDQQVRGTSSAKNVDGLAHQKSALDRARNLKEQFNRAANRQEHEKQSEQSKSGAGSQMIKEDKHAPRPTPTGPMRAEPDKAAFAEKLQKDRDNEAKKLETAKKAQEIFNARQGKSPDHERDRER